MWCKTNWLAGVLFAVMVLSWAIYYGSWRVKTIETTMNLSESYLKAITTRNITGAMDISMGKAAEAALRSGNYPSSEIIEITQMVLSFSASHANIQAEVEFLRPNGMVDVATYRVETISKGEEWKVHAVTETEPIMLGNGLFLAKVKGELFSVYHALVDGIRTRESTVERLLVGPAKQRLAYGLLELPKQFGELKGKVIASGAKKIKIQFSTESEMSTIQTVTFYKTVQGWKVFDIG